jgi:N-acetylglucosamine-6-sulfatase
MHGSHGLKGKMYPYAESVNVPLIMRWPGTIAPGRRTDELYTPMDHLPTFCSLADVPVPTEADGVDLSELVRGGAGPGRDAVLLMNYVAGYANFKTGGVRPEWRGVHTGRHTYVRWLDGGEALFDNAEDPYQLRNLVEDDSQSALLEGLRERAGELLAEAHDEFLPGTAYAQWYETGRNLVRTALGPVV